MPTKVNKNIETKELEVIPSSPSSVSNYTKTHPGAVCVLLHPNAARSMRSNLDCSAPFASGSRRSI
jgi:hypothetical protein